MRTVVTVPGLELPSFLLETPNSSKPFSVAPDWSRSDEMLERLPSVIFKHSSPSRVIEPDRLECARRTVGDLLAEADQFLERIRTN